jgi:hypothetical protein
VRTFQVGVDQLVEAFFGGLQQVAPFARSHAGIIHQKVKRRPALARKCDESRAIVAAPDVTLEDFAARLLVQGIGRILTSPIRGNYRMSLRKLRCDGAADPSAGAGNNRCWLCH